MPDHVTGHRNGCNDVIRGLFQLQRALVFHFLHDTGLHIHDRALCIDKVVVEQLPQTREGGIRHFLEGTIAVPRGFRVKVGFSHFFLYRIAIGTRFSVQVGFLYFTAAVELAVHTHLLIDIKHDNMKNGFEEMNFELGFQELPAQLKQAVMKKFQAFNLHLCSGEAIHHHTVAIFRTQEGPHEEPGHFAVTHHHPGILQPLGFGAGEEVTDHDRGSGQSLVFHNEAGLGSLTSSGSTV